MQDSLKFELKVKAGPGQWPQCRENTHEGWGPETESGRSLQWGTHFGAVPNFIMMSVMIPVYLYYWIYWSQLSLCEGLLLSPLSLLLPPLPPFLPPLLLFLLLPPLRIIILFFCNPLPNIFQQLLLFIFLSPSSPSLSSSSPPLSLLSLLPSPPHRDIS